MRMLVAAHNLEFLEHLPPERVLRQHAFDGDLDGALGMSGQHLLERLGLQVADRAGVAVVDLVLELAARDADFLGVDDYDEVARVDVRLVNGLVLAAQPVRESRGQTAERFALGVDEEPIAADGLRVGRDGFHASRALAGAGAWPAKEAESYWPPSSRASRNAARHTLYTPAMPSAVTWPDRLIAAVDQGLRAIAAPPGASRVSPGAAVPEPDLSAAERHTSAALMRVNHAGEIAAQALYHGQSLFARSEATRELLANAAKEERDHLA